MSSIIFGVVAAMIAFVWCIVIWFMVKCLQESKFKKLSSKPFKRSADEHTKNHSCHGIDEIAETCADALATTIAAKKSALKRVESELAKVVGDCLTCSRCGTVVQAWFMDSIRIEGVFAGRSKSDTCGGGYDSFNYSSFEACYHCVHGWPFPEDNESEDDYDKRLEPLLAEERAARRSQP